MFPTDKFIEISFQAHSEEYSAMVREIDGNEKVSEWMERNKVSGGGCCDPISPLPELDHRVIQPDLLVQVKLNQLVLSYMTTLCNMVNRGSEKMRARIEMY